MRPKVVILCGGKGTRLREETESKPKPLVTVGEMPILWHIMKHYSYYGFNDFILCLGYKGELIKEYFLNYKFRRWDIKLNLKDGIKYFLQDNKLENWNIYFVDTGLETNTGGRIKKIAKYIEEDYFFLTYGDGVSNINLQELEDFFLKKGKIGVITGVKPESKYGEILVDSGDIIAEFNEKPLLNNHINGGFCVFNKEIFNYMNENSILEKEVFRNLARDKELALYKHEGFWKCMDTYKDCKELNKMWHSDNPPWQVF
ncbi:MAG: glucose-1-phosphate cytidylyltransferase [Firmicutes bacterium]|nr:glucose-1-phosphate cytidylyltransferase [Bacillota bacterium]